MIGQGIHAYLLKHMLLWMSLITRAALTLTGPLGQRLYLFEDNSPHAFSAQRLEVHPDVEAGLCIFI